MSSEKSIDGSILVIMKRGSNNEENDIKLLELPRDDFISLRNLLIDNIWKVTQNVCEFNGEYKPDIDESLCISNFKLPTDIKNAIENPLNLEELSRNEIDVEYIKAILFVKKEQNKYVVVGQKFKKSQYLTANYLKILWNENTYKTYKNPGINITDNVDCYYKDGKLYFKSYYMANQIFDLSEYYREATNEDLNSFINLPNIHVENVENLRNCKKNIRKKIATLLDSNVLQNYKVGDIYEKAKSIGISITISDDKIVFPDESDKQKELLQFLLDEIYKGNFSNEVFVTNSKRTIN